MSRLEAFWRSDDQRQLVIIFACAHGAHEMNRAYCKALGDHSQPPWHEAPEWQRQSAIEGVRGALAGNTPRQSHESWLAHKQKDGWVFGEVKDPAKKTHPCMVPYDELDEAQKRKDEIFLSAVRTIAAALLGMPPAVG